MVELKFLLFVEQIIESFIFSHTILQEDEDETFHTASDGSRSASAVFREEEEVETEQREETSTARDNSDRRRDRDAEEARPEIGEMNIQLTVTLGVSFSFLF